MSWKFPIFLATHEMSQSWCKFCPNSDFMVYSTSFLCPFIISEVVSQKDESDRYRMLVQSIAYCSGRTIPDDQWTIFRGGHLPSQKFDCREIRSRPDWTSQVGLSLCLSHLFFLSRRYRVSIAQRNFDLTSKSEAVSFLREMYNLATMLEDLVGKLGPQKEGRLSSTKTTASKVGHFPQRNA